MTIGAYDGVHLGHRRVIEQVRQRAGERGLRSVVITFDKHPASVVHPASAPQLLTDLAQKLELLRATGIDQVLVLRFDLHRAKEPAEDFVSEVLVDELSARVVVVGDDFHFGHERKGNVALLRDMGADAGFSVEPINLIEDEGRHEVVSSTRIRALIAKGELDSAAELLGRPHEVRGTIAEPAGDGMLVLEVPPEILLPPPGRYDASAGTDGGRFAAVRLSVLGRLGDGPQVVEIAVVGAPAGSLPLGGAAGDVVRLRFEQVAVGSVGSRPG